MWLMWLCSCCCATWCFYCSGLKRCCVIMIKIYEYVNVPENERRSLTVSPLSNTRVEAYRSTRLISGTASMTRLNLCSQVPIEFLRTIWKWVVFRCWRQRHTWYSPSSSSLISPTVKEVTPADDSIHCLLPEKISWNSFYSMTTMNETYSFVLKPMNFWGRLTSELDVHLDFLGFDGRSIIRYRSELWSFIH